MSQKGVRKKQKACWKVSKGLSVLVTCQVAKGEFSVGVVVQTCNLHTWEAAGRSGGQFKSTLGL